MFKKKRCEKCLKKDLLFNCKCDKNFCLSHLPWFEHSCTYNFKENKKGQLFENNPKIEASKLQKI